MDGDVLPAAPLTAFADGRGSGVPLLIGSNHDEARLFLVAASTIDLIDDTALTLVAGAYGLPADGLALYRANRPGASPGDILAAVVTDWFFRVPPIRVAEARENGGASRTWMYRFDYPAPADNHGLGACHGVEIPFVFGNVDVAEARLRIGDTPSPAVADQAHRVWVDFITRGDPGWAAYAPAAAPPACSPRASPWPTTPLVTNGPAGTASANRWAWALRASAYPAQIRAPGGTGHPQYRTGRRDCE